MLPSLSGEARDARLRIAGTGPDEVRLRALARELGVEDRVEFLGAVPLEKMPDFYRDLDLYLQPSIEISHEASGAVQAESMGRSLCEAQACGIPVIASRCGGIPDVVHDGVSGRLVVPGDAGALAETVAACLSKPDHLARMGEAGRRLAVERFSWEVVVGEMARSIEQVAGRAAPPCPASCSN
jgi:glycosyltransferase involved in cell wall biosynthesis